MVLNCRDRWTLLNPSFTGMVARWKQNIYWQCKWGHMTGQLCDGGTEVQTTKHILQLIIMNVLYHLFGTDQLVFKKEVDITCKYSRCGFVQEHNQGVVDELEGNGEPLLLPPGESVGSCVCCFCQPQRTQDLCNLSVY